MEKVRLLTYNVFMRPPITPANVVDDAKDARLEELKKILVRYDIVCLQEMFATANTRRSSLLHYARNNGFPFHVASPQPKLTSLKRWADGGVVLLSRLPITDSGIHIFSKSVHADALAAKGVLFARVEVRDPTDRVHYLNVFTTHLQASYVSKKNVKNLLVRDSQMDELRDFVEKMLGREEERRKDPTVILGDMNVDGRPLYQKIPAFMGGFGDSEEQMSVLSSDRDSEVDRDDEITVEEEAGLPESDVSEDSSGLPPLRIGNERRSTRASSTASSCDRSPHSGHYLNMMERITPAGFTMRDLCFEAHQFHPVTVGDVFLVPSGDEGEFAHKKSSWMRETLERARTKKPEVQRRMERKMLRILMKGSKSSKGGVVVPPPTDVSCHPNGDICNPSVGRVGEDLRWDVVGGQLAQNSSNYVALPREFMLTNPDDYGGQSSLDYIFMLEETDSEKKNSGELVPDLDSVRVETFDVRGNPSFTQVSDHYGVSCVFTVNASPE